MPHKIAVLPGDGIGPEVMQEALKVLDATSRLSDIRFDYEWADVGGAAIDSYGQALPAATLQLCEDSDAILFGSIGGPRWEHLPSEQQPERASLLVLRKHFQFYANIRPVRLLPEMAGISPLKNEILKGGLDIVLFRELTGGLYYGQPQGRESGRAYNTLSYTRPEVERIVRLAFETARARKKILHSIDKANVLITMVYWREIVQELSADYPDVRVEHVLVDNAAIQLVKNPAQFDVIVTSNLFGDILSDEAGAIIGSMGMLPSASVNEQGFGLYEPAGGSAPDIAGQGIANPIAQILCVALMLRYSFGRDDISRYIENAVHKVLRQGYRTGDIYEPGSSRVSTAEMGDLIVQEYEKLFQG